VIGGRPGPLGFVLAALGSALRVLPAGFVETAVLLVETGDGLVLLCWPLLPFWRCLSCFGVDKKAAPPTERGNKKGSHRASL
jgi:hypothetical protein